MNGTAPSVTVLMTVFNGRCWLEESIRSILRQDFGDYEFLIVDDASIDDSLGIIGRFAETDARIRIIRNDRNKGQTACLNQGLRKARGTWIARQDADDVSLPGRFSAQWGKISKAPDLMIAGVNGWVIDEGGVCRGMIHAPGHDSGIRWSLPFRNPFIHAGVMFRRLFPDGTPVLYDESFGICQDWELWGRLLESGTGMNLPDRLVAYRHQEGSLSHRNLEKTRMESGLIVKKYWERAFAGKQADEEAMVSFREGLKPVCRRRFWNLYHEVLPPGADHGIKQAEALHHLQAAGSVGFGHPETMLWEIMAALKADPLWSSRTLLQSACKPGIIRAS